MKKLLIAALVFIPCSALAGSIPMSASLSQTLTSKYIWRGEKSGNAALQQEMSISVSDTTFDVWNDFDLKTSKLIETDLTVDYTKKLPFKLPVLKDMSVSVGNIIYQCLNSQNQELYLGLGYSGAVDASLTYYYDHSIGEQTYASASISKDFDFKPFIVTPSFFAGYNLQSKRFWDGNLEIQAGCALNKNLSISAFAAYTFPLTNYADDNGVVRKLYGGISAGMSF